MDSRCSKSLTQNSINKHYEKSKERAETFHGTLQRFVAVLKERNVDKELNIIIKDPSEFTPNYILGIVDKIQEGRDSAPYTKSCKTFIRRCYRKVEDNRDVIQGFLDMIPDDVYGSVISSGFTFLMVVSLVYDIPAKDYMAYMYSYIRL